MRVEGGDLNTDTSILSKMKWRMRWTGHVKRISKMRSAYMLWARHQSTHSCRWKNNIKSDLIKIQCVPFITRLPNLQRRTALLRTDRWRSPFHSAKSFSLPF